MPEYTMDELEKCYQFARGMIGNHNPNMIMEREDWEIFRDDFRGKLGEVALRKFLANSRFRDKITEEIDFGVYPRSEWDSNDLVVNDVHVNVKSVKGGSNFLMVETFRYNEDGTYTYDNHDGSKVEVDAYVLVNVKIEPEYNRLDFKYETLEAFMGYGNRKISYWIKGGIRHEQFWKMKHFAPEGILCTKPNLKKVCNGQEPVIAPKGTKRELVLQKDNYIIDGETELEFILEIFNDTN